MSQTNLSSIRSFSLGVFSQQEEIKQQDLFWLTVWGHTVYRGREGMEAGPGMAGTSHQHSESQERKLLLSQLLLCSFKSMGQFQIQLGWRWRYRWRPICHCREKHLHKHVLLQGDEHTDLKTVSWWRSPRRPWQYPWDAGTLLFALLAYFSQSFPLQHLQTQPTKDQTHLIGWLVY